MLREKLILARKLTRLLFSGHNDDLHEDVSDDYDDDWQYIYYMDITHH